MSRVRASSQGPSAASTLAAPNSVRKVPGAPKPHGLSLEEMRQRMLARRPMELQQLSHQDLATPATGRGSASSASNQQALLVGRSLVISTSPPHPSSSQPDASDPHKLFQMLRRKKRGDAKPAPSAAAVGAAERTAPTPPTLPGLSPDRSEPHPALEAESPGAGASSFPAPAPPAGPTEVPPRPQCAYRPPPPPPPSETAPPRYAFSAGGTERAPGMPSGKRAGLDRSAVAANAGSPPHATTDGRPATRQKLPSQSLDLFEAANGAKRPGLQTDDSDPFPRPAARRSAGSKGGGGLDAKRAQAAGSPGVNFNCLFVSGDGDLDGTGEEFPVPKAPVVDIPLIETEWFSAANTWEEIPGGVDASPEVGDLSGADDASQTLYELLVAYKGRRSAKRNGA